jgi:hypothetical protein
MNLLHAGSLLTLFLSPEDGRDIFLRNFNRVHCVISQKIELFTTTAERTSSPTVVPSAIQHIILFIIHVYSTALMLGSHVHFGYNGR